MHKEYDFKGAERGKFFRSGAAMHLPVYLDTDVRSYLSKRAEKAGKSLDALLNEILEKEIARIESTE
jgi:hypothetical protein